MEYRVQTPKCGYYLEYILDKEHVDFLWERIEDAKKLDKSHKNSLAGNISRSLLLKDKDQKFQELISACLNQYLEVDPDLYKSNEYVLGDSWVNFQKKHEFNPTHHHGGEFSYVIWMKIPTDWREQHCLPFLDGVEERKKKVSDFEFTYMNMLGNICHDTYHLDSDMEGHMLLFPAMLQHQVYPFYECDEERISISGNILMNGD
jgi:hypothetical protein